MTTNAKKRTTGAPSARVVPGDTVKVRIDRELASLIPPLGADELAGLADRLLAEGCAEPLVVWEQTGILLDGHHRYQLCRQHGLRFSVRFVALADRAAAKAYLRQLQLARRNLSGLSAGYQRGKHYLDAKQSHGGDRKSSTHQKDQLKEGETTAQRLGKLYGKGEATIVRDGELAEAVDQISANCGAWARDLVLARDGGLTRHGVLHLAELAPGEQRAFMEEFRATGKPPRREGEAESITLPREPRRLAEKLLDRLGLEGLLACAAALQAVAREEQRRQSS